MEHWLSNSVVEITPWYSTNKGKVVIHRDPNLRKINKDTSLHNTPTPMPEGTFQERVVKAWNISKIRDFAVKFCITKIISCLHKFSLFKHKLNRYDTNEHVKLDREKHIEPKPYTNISRYQRECVQLAGQEGVMATIWWFIEKGIRFSYPVD